MPKDVYGGLVHSGLGARVASALGLPRPERLRRYAADAPLIDGPVVIGGHGSTPALTALRDGLAARGVELVEEPPADGRLAGVVADLTEARNPADLESLRATVAPVLRRLGPSARVVVIGRTPALAADPAQRAARRALEGVTRSVGKELRRGGTANLVLVDDGAEAEAEGTVEFLLSGRSAFVSGQVVHVGAAAHEAPGDVDPTRPLAGKVAVVTGAARGIGAAIARSLARDGATLVCVDMPAAGAGLAAVANEVGGTALQLDVTAPDAGARIVEHSWARHHGLDIVVHNAGITRDKLLANMAEDRWASVIDVNLGSILAMNESILAEGGLRDGGHVVLVSSIAGIAGNRGQTNYAASKAGVIGLVDAYAADADLAARGITINAVAPGFIETEMTARIPLATREVGRRLNSLSQGGLPLDVAETIAFFGADEAGAVTGNVVRVCGQSLLGA